MLQLPGTHQLLANSRAVGRVGTARRGEGERSWLRKGKHAFSPSLKSLRAKDAQGRNSKVPFLLLIPQKEHNAKEKRQETCFPNFQHLGWKGRLKKSRYEPKIEAEAIATSVSFLGKRKLKNGW